MLCERLLPVQFFICMKTKVHYSDTIFYFPTSIQRPVLDIITNVITSCAASAFQQQSSTLSTNEKLYSKTSSSGPQSPRAAAAASNASEEEAAFLPGERRLAPWSAARYTQQVHWCSIRSGVKLCLQDTFKKYSYHLKGKVYRSLHQHKYPTVKVLCYR